MNQDYYVTKTWNDVVKHWKCISHLNSLTIDMLSINDKYLNKIAPFKKYFECDMCNCQGCYVCNGSGMITYYFNSEPKEPNVIEMMDKMVNEI